MSKRTASILLLVLVLLFRPDRGKAAEWISPAERLTITNFANGSTIAYDLPLLKGTAPGSDFVTIRGHNWLKEVSVYAGRWRAFVLLQPGANPFTLTTAEGYQFSFTLHYNPSTHAKKVRMVYVLGSNSPGVFDAPAGTPNAIPNAVGRLKVAARMLQSMTAELLYEKGLPRKTFGLLTDAYGEPVVDVVTVPLSVAQLRAMDGLDLWYSFYDTLSDLPDREDVIDIAIIADTHYDATSGAPLAHTALGGGRLALFGGGTLYSWPESLNQIEIRFKDPTPIPPDLFPEYARANAYWATYTTSLGAVLHELGHCLGLDHPASPSPGDIMHRGFDYLNRLAVTYEPAFGEIDPASPQTIMPTWTQADVATLQDNPWIEMVDLSPGSGGPLLTPATLSADPKALNFRAMTGQPELFHRKVRIHLPWLDVGWTAQTSGPLAIALNRTQGRVGDELIISVNSEALAAGAYTGSVTITASESAVQNNPLTIPVRLAVVDTIETLYLPLLTR